MNRLAFPDLNVHRVQPENYTIEFIDTIDRFLALFVTKWSEFDSVEAIGAPGNDFESVS